ncbi:hypothetical protein J6590_044825 [Homalodisca vitripennis]|nr:hypothetical protein J6590_044825 [Homalodisca vitripennis]
MATTGSPRRRPSPLLSPRAKYQETRGAAPLRCSVPEPSIKYNTINPFLSTNTHHGNHRKPAAQPLSAAQSQRQVSSVTLLTLFSVLTHIMATTGNPRRSPSPLLSPRANYQV